MATHRFYYTGNVVPLKFGNKKDLAGLTEFTNSDQTFRLNLSICLDFTRPLTRIRISPTHRLLITLTQTARSLGAQNERRLSYAANHRLCVQGSQCFRHWLFGESL